MKADYKIKKFLSLSSISTLVLTLTLVLAAGCSSPAASTASGSGAGFAGPGANVSQATATTTGTPGDGIDFSYSNRDTDSAYDASTATKIELAQSGSTVTGDGASVSGSTVSIQAAGSYLISGELSDGQLLVEATSEDKIQLVLNGVSISNSSGPCLLVEQADKVFVTLAPNSQNTLTDSSAWVDEVSATQTNEEGDTHSTHDGTVFSHDDIAFNGSGELTVTALAKHAIVTKDDLTITDGSYNITAVQDCLQAKDSLKILDGAFKLESGDDAISATQEEDATKGWVAIDGGTFSIKAADHIVNANGVLRTTGGKLVGSSDNEGLQGAYIQLRGGNLDITAKDDGINASSDYFADRSLVISDGFVYVDAQGDGLDSNSTMTIEGGTVVVNGPSNSGNGALDAESGATVTGGTVVALGAGGMAQSFVEGSSQASVLYSFANNQTSGTVVSITDAQGKLLFSIQASKSFSSMVFSSSELTVGQNYNVYVGGTLGSDARNGYSAGGEVSGATLLTSFTLSQATAGVAADGTVGTPQQGMGGPGAGTGGGPGGGRGWDQGTTAPDGNLDGTVPPTDGTRPGRGQRNATAA